MIAMEMKLCKYCEEDKPLTDFRLFRRNDKEYRKGRCQACVNLQHNLWVKNNPDRVKHYNLKQNYGISLEEYNQMLEKQNGKCAICERTESARGQLCVDHDAETGTVRGLLCDTCNLGIGCFRHDLDKIESAHQYLRNSPA